MSELASDPTVVDDPGTSRYELRLGDEVAGVVAYTRQGDVLDLHHTEVDDAHEGKGFGGTLARGVLDDVRRRSLHVTPTCPFIRSWIERHPDYEDLVVAAS